MSSIETAKEQVRIRERIWQERANFIRRHQGMVTPNALYLGYEDYMDLRREVEYWDLFRDIEKPAYMGMRIYEVADAHHLNVTIIESPPNE